VRLFIVDAFTDRPFKGNPAGVCILDHELTDPEYLQIAEELNQAETAFLLKKSDEFQLRWFTPRTEVDLCGHATLATAKILFDKYSFDKDVITFNTRSGALKVRKLDGKLELNFPVGNIVQIQEDRGIEQIFNTKPLMIGVDKQWYLIELESEESVRNFFPDIELLKRLDGEFIITAKSSTNDYDFVSRFFAPSIGINEDYVTGSAHCYLAKYWNNKLKKNPTLGYQASSRGGFVECELVENDRVLLRGQCVIMSELKIEWEY